MAKKEYTEQELYDLAADVHYVSQVVYLILSVDGGKTEFDWEHYQARLEEAMEYISPKYAKDYDDSVEEDFLAAMNDPEVEALTNESMKSPKAQAFLQLVRRYEKGEITHEQLKEEKEKL